MQLRSANTQGKKESELQLVFDASMEIQQDSHLDNVNEKEMKLTVLEMCVEKLNEEQKRCIDLFYLKEKSYQEVATATNFTLNNVKSYIQNGKRNLKNCIESNK
jgi:RNA polymerase sigma-70 factor (ECF subfamily)